MEERYRATLVSWNRDINRGTQSSAAYGAWLRRQLEQLAGGQGAASEDEAIEVRWPG